MIMTDADGMLASFVWTIEQFDMYPRVTRKALRSPEFRIGSYGFRLNLYPQGSKNHFNYLSVFLKRLDDCGAPKIWVYFKISLIESIQHSEYNCKTRSQILEKKGTWGFRRFFKRLSDTERIDLPEMLIVKCVLSLSKYDENRPIHWNNFSDDNDAESLSRDLKAILSSGIYSDMVLIIKENKFKVHRYILSSRCPGIMSQLKETERPGEYTLDGIEAPVLEILLEYLYTGAVSNFDNMYDEMLEASDTYIIPELTHLLNFPYYKEIRATTETPISVLSFGWLIENYRELRVNEELVYPACYRSSDEWGEFKIILTVVKAENEATRVRFKFKKLNTSKVALIRCKISFNRRTSGREYVFARDEDDTTPFEEEKEIVLSHISLRETLEIFLKISMSKYEPKSKIKTVLVDSRTAEADEAVRITNLKLLQNDLGSLYRNKSDSGDIILRVGGSDYHAHKFIMCARSPVFERMFESDTLEKKEGVVTIEDTDMETVPIMLKYIYSGYVEISEISEAIKLYSAADKYALLNLRLKCSHFMRASMDAADIGELLLLADAHNDDDLRAGVHDYMISYPKKVLESIDGLSVLQNIDVYRDVLKAFLEHLSKV